MVSASLLCSSYCNSISNRTVLRDEIIVANQRYGAKMLKEGTQIKLLLNFTGFVWVDLKWIRQQINKNKNKNNNNVLGT